MTAVGLKRVYPSACAYLHLCCMSMYRRIRRDGFVQQSHGCVCVSSSAGLLTGCRQSDEGEEVETDIPPVRLHKLLSIWMLLT